MQAKSFIEILRRRCDASSARAVAKELGVHESYISMLLNSKRKPSKRIAMLLGYERVTIYRTKTDKR